VLFSGRNCFGGSLFVLEEIWKHRQAFRQEKESWTLSRIGTLVAGQIQLFLPYLLTLTMPNSFAQELLRISPDEA
jgi:hypothetical protein